MEKGKYERMTASMTRQRSPRSGVETTSLVDALDTVQSAVVRIAEIETGPQPKRRNPRETNSGAPVMTSIIDRILLEPKAIAALRAQQPGVTTPSSESLPNLVARVLRDVRENASSARPNPSTEIK